MRDIENPPCPLFLKGGGNSQRQIGADQHEFWQKEGCHDGKAGKEKDTGE
ncbi:hypothetical protein [Geotalea toluenoxydans]|nr:hypothetical protein [Geotalea toluenoxydans]